MRACYDTSIPLILHLKDDRRLRAMAWRHIHRINPKIARALWRKVRNR